MRQTEIHPGKKNGHNWQWEVAGGAAVLAVLYLVSRANFLLFHTLTEGFSIAMALGIFMFAWNSRYLFRDDFLVIIGIGYLFVAGGDLLHMLGYPGVGILAKASTDLGAQLWLSARFIESATLLAALMFLNRRINRIAVFLIYSMVSGLLLTGIFKGLFPVCYSAGEGLTAFKIGSEYGICLILLIAAGGLYRRRMAVDRQVYAWFIGAILLTIASELAFTLYQSPDALSNLAGHFLKMLSFYLIYKAVVWTGTVKPGTLQFRDLQREKQYLEGEVAEQNRLQSMWKRQKQIMESIFNSMEDCVYIIDSDCTVVYANSAMIAICGPFEGKTCHQYMHKKPHPCGECCLDKVLAGETVRREFNWEMTGRTYDVIETPLARPDGNTAKLKIMRDITDRVTLENRIAYLARFPQENPNPVLRVQKDGILEYANDASRSILDFWGIEVGQSIPEQWWDRIRALITKDCIGTFEMPMKSDTYSVTIATIPKADNFNLYCTRITELKEAYKREKETGMLAAASKVAIDALEALDEGVALIDMAGIITKVNPALSDLIGQDTEAIMGRAADMMISELFRDEDAQQMLDTLTAAREGRIAPVSNVTLISRTSQEWIVLPKIVFIRDDQNRPVMIVLTLLDITEIVQAHRAVQEHAERLAEVQQIAKIGNWRWDMDSDELYWSEEIYRIFGIQGIMSGITFEGFLEYVHPDDRETVHEAVQAGLESGKTYSIDHRILRADGSERYVHEQGNIMRDTKGQPRAMIGTVQDITERKQLELALRAQDKLASLGRVAAGIAHEIRNPLSGIQIFTDTIRRKIMRSSETLDPEWVTGILDQMKPAARNIEMVIKRVMDFARPTVPRIGSVDMNQTVQEAVDLSRVTMRKAGITLTTEFAENLPCCSADPHLIVQVILNLINNAAASLKVVESGKKINLQTSRECDMVRVSISDNGNGVPDRIKERIFDPFFTTKQEGTGIGLSLCRRILTDHNGSLHVYDSEWGGAEFILKVPIKQKRKEDG